MSKGPHLYCPACGKDEKIAVKHNTKTWRLSCPRCGSFTIKQTKKLKELTEHVEDCQCTIHGNHKNGS